MEDYASRLFRKRADRRWSCLEGRAFNHPCGADDALGSARAMDDQHRECALAHRLHDDADDGGDHARHAYACGYDVPRHDVHNEALRDPLVRGDVVLRDLLVLSLLHSPLLLGSTGLGQPCPSPTLQGTRYRLCVLTDFLDHHHHQTYRRAGPRLASELHSLDCRVRLRQHLWLAVNTVDHRESD